MTDIVSECRAEGSNIAQRCADEIEALQARALATEAQCSKLAKELRKTERRLRKQLEERGYKKEYIDKQTLPARQALSGKGAEFERGGELAQAAAADLMREVDRLGKLVYVPGLWNCPKCAFQLVQANLNARDGSVTARDEPGDKCPNCDSPLWRVTERDAGNDIGRRAEELLARALAAEAQHDKLVEAEEQWRSRLSEALADVICLQQVINGVRLKDDPDVIRIAAQVGPLASKKAIPAEALSDTPASTGAAVIEAAVKLAPGLEKEPGIDIELRPLVAAFCTAVAAHRREGQDNG